MKKIGVITLYYRSKNLGGLLQSYAMVEVLNKLGYEAEQIRYDELKKLPIDKKKKDVMLKIELLKNVGIKKIVKKFIFIIRRKISKPQNRRIEKYVNVQNEVFADFENSIPHSKKVYDVFTSGEIANQYDGFVCGSDQVWNPNLILHSAYYLRFEKNANKKIAYAVSMGKNRLTKAEQVMFKDYIFDFQNIGVREDSLGQLVKSVVGTECATVLDPTLLIDSKEWLKIANESIVPKEKYVFCYFLGESIWQRNLVKKYAEQNGLRIVDLPYIVKTCRACDSIINDISLYNVGPKEMIGLISSAECVFTDSFHATAFSVNFEKEFYVFNRNDEKGEFSMNSRIVDFLADFKLSNRHITNQSCEIRREKIDYSICKRELKEKRSASMKWLENALANV